MKFIKATNSRLFNKKIPLTSHIIKMKTMLGMFMNICSKLGLSKIRLILIIQIKIKKANTKNKIIIIIINKKISKIKTE